MWAPGTRRKTASSRIGCPRSSNRSSHRADCCSPIARSKCLDAWISRRRRRSSRAVISSIGATRRRSGSTPAEAWRTLAEECQDALLVVAAVETRRGESARVRTLLAAETGALLDARLGGADRQGCVLRDALSQRLRRGLEVSVIDQPLNHAEPRRLVGIDPPGGEKQVLGGCGSEGSHDQAHGARWVSDPEP